MKPNSKLIEIRKENRMNQVEMAKCLHVSVDYYRKIEKGTRNPSYNFLKKFKEVFQLSIDEYFFTEAHER